MTGGRHGYGAKLTNIFSKSFVVETYDKTQNLLYSQSWKSNMTEVSSPNITTPKKSKSLKNYTKITFTPDLEKFGYAKQRGNAKNLSDQIDDFIHIATRRVFDIAATVAPINVSINGKDLEMKSFRNYVSLFSPTATPIKESTQSDSSSSVASDPVFHVDVNDRWSVSIMKSPTGEFENVSFVNSVWTSR
jgi:DNA topoisomerase II